MIVSRYRDFLRARALTMGSILGRVWLLGLLACQLMFASAVQAQITFHSASTATGTNSPGITHEGAGSVSNRDNCGTVTPSIPAGSNGDVLIALVISRENDAALTQGGAAWNALYSDNYAGNDVQVRIYWRVATGSDSLTITQAGTCSSLAAQVSRFSGVDTSGTTPFEGSSPYYSVVRQNSGDIDTGTITTSSAAAMLLVAGFVADDRTVSQGSGWSESFDTSLNVSSDLGLSLHYQLQTTSGSKGVSNWDLSGNGSDNNYGVVFALKPTQRRISIPIPSGTAANDVLVAAVSVRHNAATITPPAGWTLIQDTPQASGAATCNSGTTAGIRTLSYYKVAGAGEPTPSWGYSSPCNDDGFAAGGMLRLSGVDASSPVVTSAEATTASGTSHQAPAVTPGIANTMLVTVHSYGSSRSWSVAPTGMTERVDQRSYGSDNALGTTLGIFTELLTGTGSTGTRTAQGAGDADNGATQSIALRPASATSTTCTPPGNIPSGVTVTCQCDNFGRTSLNPSTIFGANWVVSSSDGLNIDPYINQTSSYLRLTERTANNAKAATVPGIFPAAGNYISVEFKHFAYNGTNPGADGIAVTLSDSATPVVPGQFGGSLGYAQRNDCTTAPNCPGFNGGWVGLALDEWGNYQNDNEGRVLGPGFRAQSVGIRGPGSGINGYRWLSGTGSNPGGLNIDNRASTSPAPGYQYQVIVDARGYGSGTINVSVNRDATTRDGTNYTSLFSPFNAYTEASHAVSQGWISKLVPDYWKISFTGSTGGSNNIHEIGGLRICAQTMLPPTGGTASGFSAIDEAYPESINSIPAYQYFQTGHIYMKVTGVPFKLWVAALTSTGISTYYSSSSSKHVQVKLVDNSDGKCGTDAVRTCDSDCTGASAAETGAVQTVSYTTSDKGAKKSPDFTLDSAWKNLVAVMRECTNSTCTAFTATAAACSVDSFSVRPTGVTSVTSTEATNAASSGSPTLKAGSDSFSLMATIAGIAGKPSRYTGMLKVNSAVLQAVSPATVAGTLVGTFQAAVSGTPSSTATGDFTYGEVGAFSLPGYDPAVNATSSRGVYDGVDLATECNGLTAAQCDLFRADTWTEVDSVSTRLDCIEGSYANTRSTTGNFSSNPNFGKYGCNFGLVATTAGFGRFIPDHFGITGKILPRSDLAALSTGTINGGSNSLTVPAADTAKYVPGNLVRIPGADTGGGMLLAKVTSSAGTTVTLDASAAITVTGVSIYPVDTFFYMGEPFLMEMTVKAYNAAHGITQNYAGALAKLDKATLCNSNHASCHLSSNNANWFRTGCAGSSQCFGLGAVNGTTGLTDRLAIHAAGHGSALPEISWNAGVGVATVFLTVSRPTTSVSDTTWGPYHALIIGAMPRDSDGVTLPGPTSADTDHAVDLDAADNDTAPFNNPDATLERRQLKTDLLASASVRYGRLWLTNAYGSEFLPLKVPMEAQYWTGGGWTINRVDSLTTLTVPTAPDGLKFYPGSTRNALAAGETTATMGGVPQGRLVNGDALFSLSAPGAGNYGYLDIMSSKLGAVSDWLPPTNDARVCFGSCGPRSPVIYLRERY